MSCRRRRGYRRFSTSAYRLLGDFEVAITGGVWVATGAFRRPDSQDKSGLATSLLIPRGRRSRDAVGLRRSEAIRVDSAFEESTREGNFQKAPHDCPLVGPAI